MFTRIQIHKLDFQPEGETGSNGQKCKQTREKRRQTGRDGRKLLWKSEAETVGTRIKKSIKIEFKRYNGFT